MEKETFMFVEDNPYAFGEKPAIICGLSETEIQTLKEEHGELVLVEVSAEGVTHQVIFKEPTFKHLEAITKISKTDEVKAAQAAYINYVVKADEAIEKRDLLKLKAVEALMVRVQNTKATAKNL
jgi:hypothetical protein|nr:MAG TPA: hypothetical protein [Bacteriophage sp.]